MVEVIKTGLLDTIQDFGRSKFMSYGVPISGVMDRYSAGLANSILGNDKNAAVIECVGFGLRLKFLQATVICITGANMSATLNSKPIKNNTAITVKESDELAFGALIYGCRSYVSVFGGFQTETVMESRSMFKSVTSNFRLHKGDLIPISEVNIETQVSYSSIKVNATHFETTVLEVIKGPEFDNLSQQAQVALFESDFVISISSNRMAYQFENRIENTLAPIITSLVLPGTVQLTPSGSLIVLMRDCQTTGGYPRIFQLTETAINMLSQKFLGHMIRFKCKN